MAWSEIEDRDLSQTFLKLSNIKPSLQANCNVLSKFNKMRQLQMQKYESISIKYI